jgi:uncharacterized protein YbjT (DUF2867 family)
MSTITNVAITAASGALGSVILKKLADSGKFNIKVLKRAGSNSTFPAGTDVAEVDYESFDSLKEALKGQDAVISCVTSEQTGSQEPLIDAAIAAGVKRFLPSEFGSNLNNPKTRQLPVFGHKVRAQEYISEKTKNSDMTYTFVYNGAFLDWGIKNHFLLNTAEHKPTIFDGGDLPFSATTLSSVADAVVGVLTHLEETKNRAVFVHDIVTTQNKLLALAKKVAPEKTWTPVPASLDDTVAQSDAKLAQGDYSFSTFVPYLFRAIFDSAYGGDFGADNALLGVKGVSEDDIVRIFEAVLH